MATRNRALMATRNDLLDAAAEHLSRDLNHDHPTL